MKRSYQPAEDADTEFYEALSATAGHYVYRDDTPENGTEPAAGDQARNIAIIALATTAITAIGFAILFMQGIDIIRQAR
ncbi:MAG: hypothetical protein JWN01_818 [Patescibacteria group bacterium]|nr:hypothetical protein [Patescibacteria group bacterium]